MKHKLALNKSICHIQHLNAVSKISRSTFFPFFKIQICHLAHLTFKDDMSVSWYSNNQSQGLQYVKGLKQNNNKTRKQT